MASETVYFPVSFSCFMYPATAWSSCPERANRSRSKLLETRMSIEGDMVVWKGRFRS